MNTPLVRNVFHGLVFRFWMNREDAVTEASRISSECEVVRSPQLNGWWILRHSEPYPSMYDYNGRLPKSPALDALFELPLTSKE